MRNTGQLSRKKQQKYCKEIQEWKDKIDVIWTKIRKCDKRNNKTLCALARNLESCESYLWLAKEVESGRMTEKEACSIM